MKNTNYSLLTLLAGFSLCGALVSAAPARAEAVPDYIATAPGLDVYTDADGLLVRQLSHLSLDAEGKVTRHRESALKMLTGYVARHDYLDPRIDWDDTRSELTVDRARTWMADGTLVEALANSLVENTPSELQWAVPYRNHRQMVVAHVGVEHGSTSVLAYTIADRAPAGVPFWGYEPLQSFMPIRQQEFVLTVPQGVTLHSAVTLGGPQLVVEEADGLVQHRLQRQEVPAANLAQNDHGRLGVQHLAWSTAADWAEVRTWLEARVDAALATDPDIQARAEEILARFVPDSEVEYDCWLDPSDPNAWVRLTTFNGPERPNPSLHLAGKVRMKITNRSEFFQGGHQPGGLEIDRVEPPCQAARLVRRLPDEIGYPGGGRGLAGQLVGELLFEYFDHKRDAGKLLADAVVQLLADHFLVAFGYLEHLFFELLSLFNLAAQPLNRSG